VPKTAIFEKIHDFGTARQHPQATMLHSPTRQQDAVHIALTHFSAISRGFSYLAATWRPHHAGSRILTRNQAIRKGFKAGLLRLEGKTQLLPRSPNAVIKTQQFYARHCVTCCQCRS